jgi:DNA-binding response OmpR family regulator
MEKILLVGEDFQLLSTRAAILSKLSDKVTCCNSSEFLEHIKDRDFALVVLCHSVRAEVGCEVVKETRRRWPKARVLQVALGNDQSLACVVDAVTTTEPKKLWEHVSKLLNFD